MLDVDLGRRGLLVPHRVGDLVGGQSLGGQVRAVRVAQVVQIQLAANTSKSMNNPSPPVFLSQGPCGVPPGTVGGGSNWQRGPGLSAAGPARAPLADEGVALAGEFRAEVAGRADAAERRLVPLRVERPDKSPVEQRNPGSASE